jgi:hypothetical protein
MLAQRFIEFLARFLDPLHAENLLGDLAERQRLESWSGLRDTFHLLLEEQIPVWRTWRPWLLLLVLLPPSFLLLAPAAALGVLTANLPFQRGPLQSFAFAAGMTTLLSFGVGYTIAAFSQRALPFLALALILVQAQPWAWIGIFLKSPNPLGVVAAVAVLQAIPMAAGLWSGRQGLSRVGQLGNATLVLATFVLGIQILGLPSSFFLGLPIFWPIFVPSARALLTLKVWRSFLSSPSSLCC